MYLFFGVGPPDEMAKRPQRRGMEDLQEKLTAYTQQLEQVLGTLYAGILNRPPCCFFTVNYFEETQRRLRYCGTSLLRSAVTVGGGMTVNHRVQCRGFTTL